LSVEGLKSLSEGLKFQNFSGGAYPQIPLGGCGLWPQLIIFPAHKRSPLPKNPIWNPADRSHSCPGGNRCCSEDSQGEVK